MVDAGQYDIETDATVGTLAVIVSEVLHDGSPGVDQGGRLGAEARVAATREQVREIRYRLRAAGHLVTAAPVGGPVEIQDLYDNLDAHIAGMLDVEAGLADLYARMEARTYTDPAHATTYTLDGNGEAEMRCRHCGVPFMADPRDTTSPDAPYDDAGDPACPDCAGSR